MIHHPSPTRRAFLRSSVLGTALASVLGTRLDAALRALAEPKSFKVGGCDWSLGKEGDPAAFRVAKAAGLDGVEVSCGKGKDALPISDPARRKVTLEEAKAHGLAIPSTCLEVLHRDGLKDHPDALKWVRQAIEPTRALGAKVVLLPFFGRQTIEKRSEQEAVAGRLKEVAPEAEKAGVVLGLEDTISAKDNAWILDRVKSPAVKVYYDVGNSLRWKHDVYAEVPWLGKDRVCQIHLKDKGYLGKGDIDFPRFLETVLRSSFDGWLLLETVIVKSAEEDFAANARYVRDVVKAKAG
ncbi:MAG: sugar phosphate isomerase/epimerase [Planctomycetes bacterium]|nr:sugar phosphate isomerase/epimerase [Planctomycetota bacterium]